MVEMNTNNIDFGFLDCSDSKIYAYNILILLNKPPKEILINLKNNANYIILANGCSDDMYDTYNTQFLPDCVIGDIESIREDIKLVFLSKQVKLILKNNLETTDLEKTMYYCLETFHEKTNCDSPNKIYTKEQTSKRSIMIYLDTDCGIDSILSAPSDIYKYYLQYKQEMKNTDIYLFSDYNLSIFLREGINEITSSEIWENKKYGYSIVSLCGEANITIYEQEKEKQAEYFLVASKNITFGSSFFFRKTEMAYKIKIDVKATNQCCLIYSATSKYYYP